MSFEPLWLIWSESHSIERLCDYMCKVWSSALQASRAAVLWMAGPFYHHLSTYRKPISTIGNLYSSFIGEISIDSLLMIWQATKVSSVKHSSFHTFKPFTWLNYLFSQCQYEVELKKLFCNMVRYLAGVAPLITVPPPLCQKKIYMTFDMWHLTCRGWWTFFQNLRPLTLTVWEGRYFEDMFTT